MANFTTRLGLTKPTGAEARSVTPLNTNADSIDKFLPCILVNDGVTPPTGDLYDGALVKERNSGIIWEARKNGGGTYDKVYVRYPFHFQGYKAAAQTFSSSVAYATAIIDSVNSSYCKNSSASNIASNRFVCPVKGIYFVCLRLGWAANATGERSIGFELNGTTVAGDEYRTYDSGASSGTGTVRTQTISVSTVLNVSDVVALGAWQNCGGNLNTTAIFTKIAMIEPVQ